MAFYTGKLALCLDNKEPRLKMFLILSQVIEAVVTKECQEVLTKEMAEINVEFKFYEEYNKEAEKAEVKWTTLDGKELQTVLEKLNVQRVMEAVGEMDAEGVDQLWGVSCGNLINLFSVSRETNQLCSDRTTIFKHLTDLVKTAHRQMP